MNVLFERIRNLNIPIDLQLYLSDHVILPVTLYDCKILGFDDSQIIENVHEDFIRQIFGLMWTTSNANQYDVTNDRLLVINCYM